MKENYTFYIIGEPDIIIIIIPQYIRKLSMYWSLYLLDSECGLGEGYYIHCLGSERWPDSVWLPLSYPNTYTVSRTPYLQKPHHGIPDFIQSSLKLQIYDRESFADLQM